MNARSGLSSIGLYCSSSAALPPATLQLAADFGRLCGERGIRLVYGGGARGLMGIAARAAHAAGGRVQGFMLQALIEREGANVAIGEFHVVATLAERKRRIGQESDAVVALPGGIGTLDELTEILTLDDIGLTQKPVCLVDVDGFWDPFCTMLESFDAYGVLRTGMQRDLLRAASADSALDLCAATCERRGRVGVAAASCAQRAFGGRRVLG